MSTTESAEKITRASKSNLALAFVSLPRERRGDMTTFYAFCRIVDDIADEPSRSPERKRFELDAWKMAVSSSFDGEPALDVCRIEQARRAIEQFGAAHRLGGHGGIEQAGEDDLQFG